MAISKIMHMKDCGKAYHGMHLKRSIDYITVPEKTQNGRTIGAVNCMVGRAYEQMRETKVKFNKNNQRQGYHIVLSFKEGEIDPYTAFEITQKFVDEYVGKKYEAVFAVHDNTEHIHSHIIFNSVSFVDGKKYHYSKGDWEKEIQPITNRLCKEYGLSVLEFDGERANLEYKEWSVQNDGRFIWGDMVKRDLDACILQAVTFNSFLDMLTEKGYEIKQGKYFAIKPPGMSRYKRCKSLGEEYSEERICERIEKESLKSYQNEQQKKPKIIKCYIKRYRRAKLSGIQKKYYARLYQMGKLKKRAYSQAWKYRDEIKKMQRLQQQYLFLARHNIRSLPELVAIVDNLDLKRTECYQEKSRVYKARAKSSLLFDVVSEMKQLSDAESAFKNGDDFFEAEHNKWMELESKLKDEGYSYEEVIKLQEHYRKQIADINAKAAATKKEWSLGKLVLQEYKDASDKREKSMETKERISRDKEKQPER